MHAYHRWRIHRPPVHSLRETSLCVKSSQFPEKRKDSIFSPRALRHRALEVMHRPGQAPCHLRFLSLTSALAALSHARSRWPSRVRCEACSANSRVRGGALTAELATVVMSALLCCALASQKPTDNMHGWDTVLPGFSAARRRGVL